MATVRVAIRSHLPKGMVLIRTLRSTISLSGSG